MMTQEQIIARLKSLKSDAESHREKDGTIDDVYADDIEALECAATFIEVCKTSFDAFLIMREAFISKEA